MKPVANVRSIEAIRVFKGAVAEFEEEATSALESLQQEIYRAIDWLEHDRPAYWQRRVRRGFDMVAQTRTAYESCRIRTVAGRKPACIEEREAYRKAQRDLRYAQEKVEAVKKWARRVRHDADEYRGRIGQFRTCLESDLPRMLALLDRILESLAAYTETAAPPAADDETSAKDKD